MKRLITIGLMVAAFAFANVANAQLVPHQVINGTATFRDQSTNRFWTATLGTVQSRTGAMDAPALIAARMPPPPPGVGPWRLATFAELAHMYNVSRGGPAVGFQAGLFDYYETADPGILANAYGNGIQTPQPRVGIGRNYVIATWP